MKYILSVVAVVIIISILSITRYEKEECNSNIDIQPYVGDIRYLDDYCGSYTGEEYEMCISDMIYKEWADNN